MEGPCGIIERRSTYAGETVKNFMRDETGATAIEYGLIAALIAVVIIVALSVLGEQISGGFSMVASAVQSAAS